MRAIAYMSPALFTAGILALTTTAFVRLDAKDVYGNNTAWTTSDTTIANIQAQRRAGEAKQSQWWDTFGKPLPTMTYREQEARRLEELRKKDRNNYDDQSYDSGFWSRQRRAEQERPLTYEQSLLNDVNNRSDRAAQERLGFYYVSIGQQAKAVYHLEMIVYLKKSERAGEAAFELYKIASPKGAVPDAAKATKYLGEAVALKNSDAMFFQARSWIAGDEKSGIAKDPAKGEALMWEVLRSKDAWNAVPAGSMLFKEYYLGTNLPINTAKAIEVTRNMRQITTVDNWQEDRFTELLIADGWAKNGAEIMTSLEAHHGVIVDKTKAERVARIYLGLDADVVEFVPRNKEKAADALRNLARMSPGSAYQYINVLLAPGPAHDANGAFIVLNRLREDAPDHVELMRLTAQLLNNHYGDDIDPALFNKFMASLDGPKASRGTLFGAARFLAAGGEGIPADKERAGRIYHRLLDGVSVRRYTAEEFRANLNFARMLLANKPGSPEVSEGIALLELAVSRDVPESYAHCTLLSSIYRTGTLVPRDLAKARELSYRAASGSHMSARYEYAEVIYAWDDRSAPIDDDDRATAFSWTETVAGMGVTEANLLLAEFYLKGFGVEKNPETALSILEKGMVENVPAAYAGVAKIRLAENSAIRDPKLGFEAARRGAELDNIEATEIVARCYRNGWGTPADQAKANKAEVKADLLKMKKAEL